MTPSENIKRETDEIMSRTGRYIPPYRLASLMKTAQKITDQLVNADICVTYEECQIVLDTVANMVNRARGMEGD